MSKVIEEIPIIIRNQHLLLNQIAEGYRSLDKVLMEYIDNSFDSAEDFFNDNDGRYERDVLIDVVIDRENNVISIKDNCGGMDREKIRGLANKVNESEKERRAQKRAWVTGKFGLGAHAYRNFAQELKVTSRCEGAELIAISIDRYKPNASLIMPDPIDFNPSGTYVELCGVEKYQIKHLNPMEFKKEIEIYFEGFLPRNVRINVIDGQYSYTCQAFNYDEHTGFEIKKVINSWYVGKTHVVVPEDKGIIVNLKVCTEKIDRPPYFARKGRRINYISYLDSFIRKTEHRNKVWEHHLLTGYIEVQDNLEPVISRDDFAAGRGMQQKRTGIYNEIVKLEDEIYSKIEEVNKDKSDKSLRSLASQLTNILSDLAKEEELNLRYQQRGDKSKMEGVEMITPNVNSPDDYSINKAGTEGLHEDSTEKQKEIVKADHSTEGTVEGKKVENQKQGISIEFSTLPSPSRSHYGDGIITMFTSHKDFQDRKGSTHHAELGSLKITARLANYLAAVISSEFKEIFYQQKKLEPSRKDILNQQIDFIFKMEERMKGFIDQPLQSIGELK